VANSLAAEVALMQELRHPNIVMMLGVTQEPPSIVQEYCSRGSLFGVLRRYSAPSALPLAWKLRLQMALGAATGMCYLHGCRPAVLHRDLKSPNLLVDRHWRVKVGDFGLSRVTLAATAVASAAGIHSPRWMAPEVLTEGLHSKASDMFSYGVVLWELATLAVPWEGANQWQIMHAVADEGKRCPPPQQVEPPFPTGLADYNALMGAAWAAAPAERPTFAAAVTQLEAMLERLIASARTDKPPLVATPPQPSPAPPSPAAPPSPGRARAQPAADEAGGSPCTPAPPARTPSPAPPAAATPQSPSLPPAAATPQSPTRMQSPSLQPAAAAASPSRTPSPAPLPAAGEPFAEAGRQPSEADPAAQPAALALEGAPAEENVGMTPHRSPPPPPQQPHRAPPASAADTPPPPPPPLESAAAAPSEPPAPTDP